MIDLQEDIVKLRKEIFEMMEISNKQGLVSTSDLVKANQAYIAGVTDLTDMKKNRINITAVYSGVNIGENASIPAGSGLNFVARA